MNIVDRFNQRIGRSVFAKNFFSIASAHLISQAVLFLALPILTRIFTPAEFGVAALFLSAFQLCLAFCTWNFERFVPNAGSRVAAQLLCLYAVAFLTLVCAVIFFIVIKDVSLLHLWKGTGQLGRLLYFLPLAIFAMGLVKIASSWFARETDLSILSKSVISYTISYMLIAIAGGFLGLGESALVFAIVGSYWCQALTIIRFLDAPFQWRGLTRKRVLAIGKKNLPLASSQSGVVSLNVLSLAAPVFLLSQYYGVAELGAYALVLRLVVTPLGVLTKALSVSFWSRAAQLARENKYKELHSLYKKVTLIMAVPAGLAVIFCILGSKLVPVILGEEWRDAGKLLLMITPYVIGFAMISPTNHLWVLERQKYQVIADGTRLGLMVVCIALVRYFDWSLALAVLALSVSSLIGHILLFTIHIVFHRRLA